MASAIALRFRAVDNSRARRTVEFSRFATNARAHTHTLAKENYRSRVRADICISGVSLHRRNSCERPSYFFHSTRIRVRHAYRVMHGMRVVIARRIALRSTTKGVCSEADFPLRGAEPRGAPTISALYRDFELPKSRYWVYLRIVVKLSKEQFNLHDQFSILLTPSNLYSSHGIPLFFYEDSI